MMKFISYILLIAVLFSCRAKDVIQIPALWVNADKEYFEQKQGVLYLHHQPFSGHQYALFENGDTAFVSAFYNGREEGLAKEWYANKQLKEIRRFANGKKVGEHKGWWENGRQKFIYHFAEDVFNGQVKEWYANGQAFRHMNYSKGYETGLQRIWQPDGSVFANYEVRNGRNYGLTGTTHCLQSISNRQ